MKQNNQPLTQETSGFVAMLKTAGFFAVIIAIIGAAVYYGTSGTKTEKPKADGYKYLEISELASFDYYTPPAGEELPADARAEYQIPERIQQLSGQKVSITGFMMPVRVDDQGNVDEFALNGNYDMCFYGAPSQLNQWVHVKMQPGAKAKFSHNPTLVSGTLEVGELKENGTVVSLYRLTGDKAATINQRGLF